MSNDRYFETKQFRSLISFYNQQGNVDLGHVKVNLRLAKNWCISYILRIFRILNLQSTDVFLDIGSGLYGYSVIEAARNNIRSIGIDVSIENIKTANSLGKKVLGERFSFCNFILCSATNLPLRDHIMSKISSIAVIEHVSDDEMAIKEMARTLKKQGHVLIMVPNTYRRMPPIFSLLYKLQDRYVEHLRHYKAEDLSTQFSTHGFSTINVFYISHIVKVLQVILCLVIKRLGKPNSRSWWKLEKIDNSLWRFPHGMGFLLHLKKPN